MTAKDNFFKNVEESGKAKNAKIENVKSDISIFQNSMLTLAGDIKRWFQGTDVVVETIIYDLQDESILRFFPEEKDLSTYDITLIQIQHDNKVFYIIPNCIYAGTDFLSKEVIKGQALLIKNRENPTRFMLCSNGQGVWKIRSDRAPITLYDPVVHPLEPFTEEKFFEVLQQFL
ncbi:hypothetical protein H0261_02170 [Pectobacterium versatile]|uniref:hypothetical protein n=1 Tax=Pectobacterium TaxID=122277 RepID=UPI000E280BCC|nr:MULTISPECIES: hypothetical protein [Pectobacterium]MBA0182537.1 hypothetical protein [Pectobacterium versatile]RRO01942.1 hypothetical protein DMB83_011955 [Pectobacterium aquaticum]